MDVLAMKARLKTACVGHAQPYKWLRIFWKVATGEQCTSEGPPLTSIQNIQTYPRPDNLERSRTSKASKSGVAYLCTRGPGLLVQDLTSLKTLPLSPPLGANFLVEVEASERSIHAPEAAVAGGLCQ